MRSLRGLPGMAERVFICSSDALADGGPGVRFDANYSGGGTALAAATAPLPRPAFVIRHRGRPYAYLNRCGHVPVELDWEHGAFFDYSGHYLICSTHGALYGPESGICISGRCAGRGLVRVAVEEAEGKIWWLHGATDDT